MPLLAVGEPAVVEAAVGADAADAIARFGRLPLPPYIRRDPTAGDETRYQTVYAEREGSVAAPTAGLHFTPEILAAVEARGAELARIELEVGPGTFRPVEAASPAEHPMHVERYDVPERAARAIEAARGRRGRIWAVGTTVVRALESAAAPDGAIGPATLAKVQAARGVDVCAEFGARRLLFMAGLPTWRVFGPGWSRRLSRLPYEAMGMRP